MEPNETTALLNSYNSHNTDHYSLHDCNKSYIIPMGKDVSNDDSIYWENDSSLTLEELLAYVEDPWWQKIRFILFYTFWLSLLMIFLLACLITYSQIRNDYCKAIPSLYIDMTSTQSSSLLFTTLTQNILN